MPRRRLEKKQDQTYAFRIESQQKEQLDTKVERLRNAFNKENPDDRYKVTKNEVVIAALKKGLHLLKETDLPTRRKKDV